MVTQGCAPGPLIGFRSGIGDSDEIDKISVRAWGGRSSARQEAKKQLTLPDCALSQELCLMRRDKSQHVEWPGSVAAEG